MIIQECFVLNRVTPPPHTHSLIGLIREYILFDLKNLWFIIRVHLTNLTLDIELDTWSIDLTNNYTITPKVFLQKYKLIMCTTTN